MNTASKLALALVALAAVATTSVQAQGVSNTITATAAVQTPLTVTGTTTLDFGNVFPGVNKTIAPTDATAGKFTVGGQSSAQVNVTFSVPSNLANGINNLPINTWVGGYDTDNTQPSQTVLNTGGTTTTNLDAGTGALYVWLGATVAPGAAQVAGTYNALVTMTVAYTGL